MSLNNKIEALFDISYQEHISKEELKFGIEKLIKEAVKELKIETRAYEKSGIAKGYINFHEVHFLIDKVFGEENSPNIENQSEDDDA